jgi:hypothetical protein
MPHASLFLDHFSMNKIDFSSLPREQLERMADAGFRILECYRVLSKGGLNVVGEVLRGQGEFYEMEHYPKDDVSDPDTHSQYYYHAHREGGGEHGHFHTFLRQPGMPEGVQPIPHSGVEPWPEGNDSLSHLIAISMDSYGFPIGLFATNRWVTAEAWYKAEDVIGMLNRFQIDHAWPSWPVNIWISSLLILFRPQIETLLYQRDQVIRDRMKEQPSSDVLEDRELELTGYTPINVELQIKAIVQTLEAISIVG